MKLKLWFLVLLSSLTLVMATGCGRQNAKETGNATEATNTDEAKPDSDAQSSSNTNVASMIIGIPQDLDSLDPHYAKAAGTREVLFNIFEGLLKPDSNGNLLCALASEYEIQDDGLTYVFTLRDGVKFHDGTDVTIDDVAFSILRCAGSDGKEPLVPAFSYIDQVKTEGNKLYVTLDQKHPEILYSFTTAIVPKAAVENDTLKSVIGTGPYKLAAREPQAYIDLVRNDDYYGEKGKLETARFKIIADPNMIATELKSGAVHMFARISNTQAKEAEGSCNILEGSMSLVQALYLNNTAKPFDDVRVRKALNYAIDRKGIIDLVFAGRGHIIGSSMVPGFKRYYVPELENAYEYDIEKAKSLLAEAGYPNGFDMEITVPSNYQPHIDTAQVIVEQLKAVGINATIKSIEWASWLSEVYTDHDYQTTVIGVDGITLSASAFLSRFTSDGSGNFINFFDEEYDAKFNEAQEYEDLDEQAAIYQECERILSDRAANVYIQDMSSLVALNKDYAGYQFYPLYVLDLAKLYKVAD